MATTKNKNISQSHQRSSKKNRLLQVLLLTLTFIMLGFGLKAFLAYQNKNAIEADRMRFVQADKDVQKISNDIVAAAGQPHKKTESKSCGRPSTKYEEGPLYCSSERTLVYFVGNEISATTIYNTASTQIKKRLQYRSVNTSNNLQTLKFEPYEKYIEQKIYEKYETLKFAMSCYVTYRYDSVLSLPTINQHKFINNLILEISLNCKDVARSHYYELKE